MASNRHYSLSKGRAFINSLIYYADGQAIATTAGLSSDNTNSGGAGGGGGGGGGGYISTDDLVTAKVWKALCRLRIEQLSGTSNSIAEDSAEVMTTLSRACNVRRR